ncbi:DUF4301 family protein [Yeosuana sp.]|uniref:DUF4301 family protein n=1 Tax=Yeosuana sp. TaxID=2529388 RepID=UPI004055168F
MTFSEKDSIQIKKQGLTADLINGQIELIKSGMIYSNLVAAANIGNGILKIDKKQRLDYIKTFNKKQNQLSIVKFVPASGAATRMFKFLFQFLEDYNFNEESIESHLKKNKDISRFLNGLEKLPFFEEVVYKIHELIPNFNDLPYAERCVEFVKTMLEETRLNYSYYPKGLLPFHKYGTQVSTAFEEHLLEATLYATSNNKADLHFTISEAHKKMFVGELEHIKEDIEDKTNTNFNISFSFQNKSTDTIALTSKDEIYREQDGSLLFRPSGHGALLENLNDLDYDIIFIKNIDNVVVSEHHDSISDYKKLLAGILIEAQDQAFKFLHQIETSDINDTDIDEMTKLITGKMNVVVPKDFENSNLESKLFYLKEKLNRPIRVCGMVKNEGEPGGGPFWVKDENGQISLQIVESAQIDAKNEHQVNLLKNATHFNPVDLACGVKNYKGEKFDLTQFVDPKAAFVTVKSHNGEEIKVLELPGLWNGSMAYWNTIFVEIPVSTFNPVKTVNDLLKPAHQVS